MELATQPFEEIILHHSLTKDGLVADFFAFRNYHIGTRGWGDIGYHFVIEYLDGKPVCFVGRSLVYQGAHTEGHNNTIGICVAGDWDNEAPPEDLLQLLESLIGWLKVAFPIKKISGHCQYSAKTCPGKMFPLGRFLDGWSFKKPAYLKNNLNIKECGPEDIYLLRKNTTTFREPKFDGCNGVLHWYDEKSGEFILLAMAYDRGEHYSDNPASRPKRSVLVAMKDGSHYVKRVHKLEELPDKDNILWALGGIGTTRAVRRLEEAHLGGMPEDVKRARTAIGFKDGKVYQITSSMYNYTLSYFCDKMDALGFKRESWIFLDGGTSTQAYYDNDGKPICKCSTRVVPLLVGVRR